MHFPLKNKEKKTKKKPKNKTPNQCNKIYDAKI